MTRTAEAFVAEHLRTLSGLLDGTAAELAIAEIDLRLRFGLHLPRLWAEDLWGEPEAEAAEAQRLGLQIKRLQHPFAHFASVPPTCGLDDLQFISLSEQHVSDLAQPILQRFHYLRSFRYHSWHFALVAEGNRIAALATVSPFDLWHLRPALKAVGLESASERNIRVLSRVYAFRWAPRNSISRLLSLTSRQLERHAPSVTALLTYLNPNLGLRGSSYLAAGWQLLCRELNGGPAYLDGDYVTDRELARLTRTTVRADQKKLLRDRITFTSCPWEPLDIYATPVNSPRGRLGLTEPPMVEFGV